MSRDTSPRLGEWARRLNGVVPTGVTPPERANLDDIERLDWELWLLVLLVLLMLALAFLLNHFPTLLGVTHYVPKPAELETYLDAFAVLVLIFTFYVIQKHRQLTETRRGLLEAHIAQVTLNERLALIETLFGFSGRVSAPRHDSPVQDEVLDLLREVMKADRASIWSFEAEREELLLTHAGGTEPRAVGTRLPGRGGPEGWVANRRQPLLLDEQTDRPALGLEPAGVEEGARSLLVPLTVHGEMLGVLALGATAAGARFDRHDLQLLQVFGNNLAAAMVNQRLIGELRTSLRSLSETQGQLLQAEKLAALGELMAGISHELNNPLSVVMGHAELLMEHPGVRDLNRRLEAIFQEASRAKRLVENLLRVARGDEAQREELDLAQAVEQALRLLRYQLELEKVEVFFESDPGLPGVLLDPFEIQQLVFNLVNNARQAMRTMPVPKRRLWIRCRHLPEGPGDGQGPTPALLLQVRDNGPGIPDETLHRIFEPFFTTKEIGYGTGLGLSICHRIAREHGGRIQAGNSPSGGAVFDVWFPLTGNGFPARPTPSGKDASAESIFHPSGALVLVIDDEERIIELLEETLGVLGYRVEGAADGVEAMAWLDRGELPAAIVLDLKMPRMDGPTFYAQLEQRFPALCRRVLFLTGDTINREACLFLESTGQPYLNKPFVLKDLRAAVETLVKGGG